MRVSYVRKIKDQIPLSQKDIVALQYTFMVAIQHKNDGVVEPLLTRGVPLTAPLTNHKTALRIAIESNCPKIVEMLLVESMRTFQLFPENDIVLCFEWILKNQHYQLIDLTIFALKQSSKSLKMFESEIRIIDFFEKLIGLYQKNEVQAFHLKEFEDLLKKQHFSKPLYFYLYHKWDTELSTKYTDSLDCYRLLADFYYEQDKSQRIQQIRMEQGKITTLFLLTLGLVLGSAMIILRDPHSILSWMLCVFSLISGTIFWNALKHFSQTRANIEIALQDRLLLKCCRDGDYAQASELIQKGAHINILAGIGESTPLYEANLCHQPQIANLLSQFNAYSGRKSQTILFP